MAWAFLVAAGLFEIGWPIGLKLGYDADTREVRIVPLLAAGLAMALSGGSLLLAQRTIPMGTAYAVWTGIGSVGAVGVGILYFKEPATAARLGCVGLIVAGIVGLKLFSSGPAPE